MPDQPSTESKPHDLPIVRVRDWSRMLIGFSPVFLLIAVLRFAFDVDMLVAISVSCLGVAFLGIGMRSVFLRFHRQGMKQLRARAYSAAILEFEKSLSYFRNHQFLDRYREILLGSYSRLSYQDMALANIAACYLQLEEVDRAREYYEMALRENPDNVVAASALRMLTSLPSSDTPSPFTISFTRDEALVLHHFLNHLTEELMAKRPDDSTPSAEELVLWKVEGVLDKAVVELFDVDYLELLERARQRVVNSRIDLNA